MPGLQDRPIGDGALDGRPSADGAVPTTPTTEHAKHWAKLYRTGIASGASSVLSTVTAVGCLGRQYYQSGADLVLVSPGLDQDTNASVWVTI